MSLDRIPPVIARLGADEISRKGQMKKPDAGDGEVVSLTQHFVI